MTINLAIGIRPLFVAGNEGGRGDIAMMALDARLARLPRDRMKDDWKTIIAP